MAASSGADLGGLLWALVFVLIPSAIWVAYDTSKRPGLSMDWALGVLFIWILFFPWYLFERRNYPVAQPAPELPPPGWYRDPEAPELQRWWDGSQWSEHRRPDLPLTCGPPS